MIYDICDSVFVQLDLSNVSDLILALILDSNDTSRQNITIVKDVYAQVVSCFPSSS